MKAILPLGIVGVIISFLMGALAGFPIQGRTLGPAEATGDETFSVEATQEVADRFSLVYGSVIDDLVSYQRDPDYERVEVQRQAMVGYAGLLVSSFQDFSELMRGKLDEVTLQMDSSQASAR